MNTPTLTFYVHQLEKESSVFNRHLDSVFVSQTKEDCAYKVAKSLHIGCHPIMDDGNDPPAIFGDF